MFPEVGVPRGLRNIVSGLGLALLLDLAVVVWFLGFWVLF